MSDFTADANEALDIYKESMRVDDSDDESFIERAIQIFQSMTGRDIGHEIVQESGV